MPYEPLTSGLKFNVRVKDLLGPDVVVVTCPACHKSLNVAPHVFYARYNPNVRLVDLERDLKCKGSGNNKEMVWRVGQVVGAEFPRLG